MKMFQVDPEAYPFLSGREVCTGGSSVWRPDDNHTPWSQTPGGGFQKVDRAGEVLHYIVEHDRIDRAAMRQTLREILING
jgi:hypothetical protein